MNTIATALRRLGACSEGLTWAETQPDSATAWATCERADWMLWLLGRLAGPPHSTSRLALVACCADCAETSVHVSKDKGIREQVRYGLSLLRRYLRGEGDLQSARKALAAAHAYASAASAYAAAAASSAAAALKEMADIVRRHYPTPPEL